MLNHKWIPSSSTMGIQTTQLLIPQAQNKKKRPFNYIMQFITLVKFFSAFMSPFLFAALVFIDVCVCALVICWNWKRKRKQMLINSVPVLFSFSRCSTFWQTGVKKKDLHSTYLLPILYTYLVIKGQKWCNNRVFLHFCR